MFARIVEMGFEFQGQQKHVMKVLLILQDQQQDVILIALDQCQDGVVHWEI